MSPTEGMPHPALDVAVAGAVSTEEEAEQVLQMRFILHWAWRAQQVAHGDESWPQPP